MCFPSISLQGGKTARVSNAQGSLLRSLRSATCPHIGDHSNVLSGPELGAGIVTGSAETFIINRTYSTYTFLPEISFKACPVHYGHHHSSTVVGLLTVGTAVMVQEIHEKKSNELMPPLN